MGNAKIVTRQVFKPLTKEKKLEVWNKVKALIATGEYCDITAKEYEAITAINRAKPYAYRIPEKIIPTTFKYNERAFKFTHIKSKTFIGYI